ncbi:hypothetical protein [Actinocrispum wychmicini]|uniref:ClpA/ClpB-like protein n=1 Tax=Actinocrispum wychmicini TaxID=1213861 RepID=A0A4R2JJT0_9PSEU|nr:hypothetical protein [Actinocrispum wychmicini]TCO59394.1 hypothetical protein EV192_104235 [Actinocrispum wychmicini]
MGIRTRLVAAAIAAALTVVTGTATASAAPATQSSAQTDGKKDVLLAKIAASLHVTVQQLVTALGNLKGALGKGTDKLAAITAFAKELRITVAQAEKVLEVLFNGGKKPAPGTEAGVPAEVVKLLAAELKISQDRARQVVKDLAKVGGKGDDILKDPAFIAIAKGLGVSPQRLLDALRKVKQEYGKPKDDKTLSGAPGK